MTKAIRTQETLLSGYLTLLSALSREEKKVLIKKLNTNIKKTAKPFSKNFLSTFGAWEGDETAEDLAQSIRNARTENPIRQYQRI